MRGCGVFALARVLSAEMARVLMYHNFRGPSDADEDALSVVDARRQFEYLRRYFLVVPLHHIVDRLNSSQSFDHSTVAITIDDGRRNCYEFLFPLLREFDFPATFFVVSSFISRHIWIWTDKVLWLSEQQNRPEELAPGKLDSVFRELNRMRPEVRNQQVETMAAKAGVSFPAQPPAKYAPCSWAELREMADSGLVEIGSHTVTHPILSSITDDECRHELTESRRQIEEGVGRKVRSFCFPNGMPGDYRPSQVRQLADVGYTCGVMAHFGLVKRQTSPYSLPRLGMARKFKPLDFSKYLDGVAYYQYRLGNLIHPNRDRAELDGLKHGDSVGSLGE
jgi:peptidoglycan/xylan/chitin deacetylase (PgdA/CDA1 family)